MKVRYLIRRNPHKALGYCLPCGIAYSRAYGKFASGLLKKCLECGVWLVLRRIETLNGEYTRAAVAENIDSKSAYRGSKTTCTHSKLNLRRNQAPDEPVEMEGKKSVTTTSGRVVGFHRHINAI